MSRLIDRTLIDRWRRAQDRTKHNWEDKRALSENIQSVLADTRPLRKPAAPKASLQSILDGGNIGRTVVLPPAINTGPDGVSVLSIEGDDEKTTVITVTLVHSDLVPNDQRATRAIIEWGAAGVPVISTELDYLTGTTFSIPTSFLRINARRTDANAAQDLRVGAFASYLPISGGKPQLTLDKDDRVVGAFPVVPAAQVTWLIPAFARNLRFYRDPTVPMTITMRALGVVSYDQQFILAERSSDVIFPLGNEFRAVSITNNDAVTDIDEAALIFELF